MRRKAKRISLKQQFYLYDEAVLEENIAKAYNVINGQLAKIRVWKLKLAELREEME